jgi:hypothetical protein
MEALADNAYYSLRNWQILGQGLEICIFLWVGQQWGLSLWPWDLLYRYSIIWAMSPVLSALGIFEIGFMPELWSYLCFLHSCDDRHVPPCPAFIAWDEPSQTFCLGWPWTVILPISALQVARITGMSRCAWLWKSAFLTSSPAILITIKAGDSLFSMELRKSSALRI